MHRIKIMCDDHKVIELWPPSIWKGMQLSPIEQELMAVIIKEKLKFEEGELIASLHITNTGFWLSVEWEVCDFVMQIFVNQRLYILY